jgi:hypothetical protein
MGSGHGFVLQFLQRVVVVVAKCNKWVGGMGKGNDRKISKIALLNLYLVLYGNLFNWS